MQQFDTVGPALNLVVLHSWEVITRCTLGASEVEEFKTNIRAQRRKSEDFSGGNAHSRRVSLLESTHSIVVEGTSRLSSITEAFNT